MGRTKWDDVWDMEQGESGCRCMAREKLEAVYSWGTDRKRKTEESVIGDKEEYHKRR